jgi:CRP-like cAMP-binding protein
LWVFGWFVMGNELLTYLSRFSAFSEAELADIAANLTVHTYEKGTVLLREGEISTKCYFVLKGCVRQYFLVDGEEKTTAFFTEEQSVVSFTSYSQQVPCNHYFACVEETTAMVGDPRNEAEMYERFPKLATLTREMMEQDFGKTQEEFAMFVTSSPEERYRHLLARRPELLQRVPQHQIASYLGVTPESLSRIRKRISGKK